MADMSRPQIDADALMQLANDGHVGEVSLAGGRYTGLDLSGVRFESVSADGAIFENCTLAQSSWQDCQLDGAHFERVNLVDSRFVACTATNLSFTQSDLSDTWWQDSTFTQPDFSSSQLDGLAATACRFISARLPHRLNRAWISECQMPDAIFSEPAHWHQVQVLRSQLPNWDLSNATFTQCAFGGSMLDGLRATALRAPYLSFWQCSMRGAELSQAELEGANFDRADITDARFTNSNLTRARLVQAQTGGASFVYANLTQADASHLQAGDADFSRSRLDLLNVHGAQMDQACWQGCDRSRLRGTDVALLRAEQWQAAKR